MRALILLLSFCLGFGWAQNTVPPPVAQPIRAIELVGVTAASGQEIGKPLEALVNTTPDQQTLQSALRAVEGWYHGRGYTLAKVVSYDQKPDGTLVVEVAEGRIESIEITGNKRTRKETLLQEIPFKAGSLFREAEAVAIRRRLGRLPYLREVKVAPVPTEEVGKARLQVQVEEEQAIQLALAVGYSSEVGFVGYVDAGDANFMGLGHQVRLQWQRDQFRNPITNEIETTRASYNLLYEAPRVIGRRIDVGIEGYDRGPFYPIFSSLENNLHRYERRRGFAAWLGYNWHESLAFRVRFRDDRVDYNDAPLSLLSLAEQASNRGRVMAVGFQGIWDSRERLNFPRTGGYLSFLVESATSPSDFRFTRYLGEVRYYLSLMRTHSLAFRVVGGGTSGGVPLSEEFWAGGFELLRGYQLDEFHGDRLLVASVEYRLPIMPDIQGAIFIDHGLAWQSGQNFSLSDFKTGVGLGVRFATPIGPIRLDFAVGKKSFTYLSLGQAF